jgi:hypothetical protein
MPQQNGLSIAQ